MMSSTLTTRQRDILKVLLDASRPLASSDIADAVQLSARQVNYSLKGVERWLKERRVALQTTPGVGVALDCPVQDRGPIRDELESATELQLILTPLQRQQLLCFLLLFEQEPVIVNQLTHLVGVSRTTILNDLSVIDEWLEDSGITIQRRQNYGMWADGSERTRQQVIARFIWGHPPFDGSLFDISFHDGLTFSLVDDAHFLPLVQRVNDVYRLINFNQIFNTVVYVEDFLGGRFTDEAVLFLALILSILSARSSQGEAVTVANTEIARLQVSPVWDASDKLLQLLDEPKRGLWQPHNIAYVAMYILSSPRHESWPAELNENDLDKDTTAELLTRISEVYGIADLRDDPTLKDALVNHLIPVCNKYLYDLWFPQTQTGLPIRDKYAKEHQAAAAVADLIRQRMGITLSDNECGVLASLLRAASIRIQPHHFKQVLVVCPSGMATAQLLIARLNSRFPRLGEFTVVSYRELDQQMINNSDLVLTMMPLPADMVRDTPVIQVSPQLLPEDVEAITSFLS